MCGGSLGSVRYGDGRRDLCEAFRQLGLVRGSLLQKAFTETLRLLSLALRAVILAIFIGYILEDWTCVLGSSVGILAMVVLVERQRGFYRSN